MTLNATHAINVNGRVNYIYVSIIMVRNIAADAPNTNPHVIPSNILEN